jgi:hypothetical protein
MTDFVTRLEAELHSAAVQRERSGRVRGLALPHLRVALGDFPAAAVATVLFALVVAGAAIILAASPERPAGTSLPSTLHGVWQAPPKELRLYPRGSDRCVRLGVGSSTACYTLGDSASGVAREWGRVSVDGDELTLRSTLDSSPGVYRWRIERGTLRLTKLRDPVSARVSALVTTPLQPVHPARARASLPIGWASHPFSSQRFGYSIQLPVEWLIDTSGPTDRFAVDPSRGTLPAVSVFARDLPPGTTGGWWAGTVDRRFESAGCEFHENGQSVLAGTTVRVSVYANCGGDPNRQAASFIHDGRGYGVIWRGTGAPPERDYPLFKALLKSIDFPR